MRKIIGVLCIILSHGALAQEASVERSVSGIQIGLGLWVHNEFKLSNSLALRSEIRLISYDLSFKRPVLTIEPRYYYNLKNRILKFKNIANNSGSFISLNISYYPGWFVSPEENHRTVLSGIFAIPTWGIRRNLGKHFNYESGIGLGYGYVNIKYPSFTEGTFEPSFMINTHLRIGYRF